jgi:two-component system, chemotaxis family, response regulator Rcp1
VNKSSYRILAVEDNASDVFLMREALKEHGVNADLTVITNGQSAIRYFSLMRREDPVPELILLDVNLPRKNGLEVLKGLRANPLLQQVPVIVFTSSESFDDRAEAARLQAQAFVRKSMDLDEFLQIGAVVKNLLEP